MLVVKNIIEEVTQAYVYPYVSDKYNPDKPVQSNRIEFIGPFSLLLKSMRVISKIMRTS